MRAIALPGARHWPLLPAGLLLACAAGLLWLAGPPAPPAPAALPAATSAPVAVFSRPPAGAAPSVNASPATLGVVSQGSPGMPEAVAAGAGGELDIAAITALQRRMAQRQKAEGIEASRALHGDEDALARYRLARAQLARMHGLSEEQKQEELAQLYRQLPSTAQQALGGPEVP